MKLLIILSFFFLFTTCMSIGDRYWIYKPYNDDWLELDDNKFIKSFNNFTIVIDSCFLALGIDHSIKIFPKSTIEIYPSRIYFKSLEDIGIVHRPFQISILQNNKEYLNITIEPINSFFEVYDYSEIYVNKIILKEANKKQKILSIHDFNNLKINIECPTEIQYRIFGFDFSDRAGYPNPKKNCFLMMANIFEDTEIQQIFLTDKTFK